MVKVLSEYEKMKINEEETKKANESLVEAVQPVENVNEVADEDDELDLLDILLDNDNKDPIRLMDSNGVEADFEQIAVIPHEYEDETRLYAILRPMVALPGVSKDDVFVFMAYQYEGKTYIKVVEDQNEAQEVYDTFLDMLDDAKTLQKSRESAKSEDSSNAE